VSVRFDVLGGSAKGVEMANGTARVVLRLLGLDGGGYLEGKLPVTRVCQLLSAVTLEEVARAEVLPRVLGSNSVRYPARVARKSHRGSSGARCRGGARGPNRNHLEVSLRPAEYRTWFWRNPHDAKVQEQLESEVVFEAYTDRILGRGRPNESGGQSRTGARAGTARGSYRGCGGYAIGRCVLRPDDLVDRRLGCRKLLLRYRRASHRLR
jgi:hypothetical protein